MMIKSQRAYDAGLREQAERRAHARIEEARRTVVEERLRIARELHDVVAHSMSVIAVQAGVGGHVIRAHPEEAAKSLAAIETVSRSTLREMRALLGVLREETPPGPDDGDLDLATPGLADLPALLERTGRAGLHVELRIRGRERPLPPSIGLASYRIVQEALTNTVKHAATSRARVVVGYDREGVEVEVTDEGRGGATAVQVQVQAKAQARAQDQDQDQAPAPAGHGLIGMRERVVLHGGEFAAGPLPLGGFRVWARLPTEAEGESEGAAAISATPGPGAAA